MAASPFRMSCSVRVTPAQPKSFANTAVPLREVGSVSPGYRAFDSQPPQDQPQLSLPLLGSPLSCDGMGGREKIGRLGRSMLLWLRGGDHRHPREVLRLSLLCGSFGRSKPLPRPTIGPQRPERSCFTTCPHHLSRILAYPS